MMKAREKGRAALAAAVVLSASLLLAAGCGGGIDDVGDLGGVGSMSAAGDESAADELAADDLSVEADAATFTPNVAGAIATLTNVVIPNLTGSTGYTLDVGDNLARMSIVRRSLTISLDLLALPAPDAVRASAVLRSPLIPILEMSPGYRKIVAGNPNSFATTKMGKARKGLDVAIAQLTGFTGSTTAAWKIYPANVAFAKGKLSGSALPLLLASTAFGDPTGDNLARMSIVKRELTLAIDILSLSVPDPARARAVLRSPVLPVLEASPAYRKILTRYPGTFGNTKIGQAHAAILFAVDELTSSQSLWQLPGVFIRADGPWSTADKGALLRNAGFGWVAIQVHDGSTKLGQAALDAGIVARYHQYGILVGGWGMEETNPQSDAATVAAQVNQYGLDFYISDVEATYKYTSPSGAPDPVAYGRSQQFVQAFRALEPHLTAAISTFGAASDAERLVDIDYAPWRAAGFDLMQQAYWNDTTTYQPSRCIRAAMNSGWPIERIHPTFGIWGGGATRIVSAQEYLNDVAGTGIYGFSTYLADQMNDSDVPVLGTGISAGLAR